MNEDSTGAPVGATSPLTRSFVHSWMPVVLLWTGAVLTTLLFALVLVSPTCMGYSVAAFPLYFLRTCICVTLALKSNTWLKVPVTRAMLWTRTIALTAAGLVSVFGLARICFWYNKYEKVLELL